MPETPTSFEPYGEPLAQTIARTFGIAMFFAVVLAPSIGGWSQIPIGFLAILWISLGGHFVELWYLNGIRPRLGPARSLQIIVRVVLWFFVGMVLGKAAYSTLAWLSARPPRPWPIWNYGIGFVFIEIIANGLMLRRRRRRQADGA